MALGNRICDELCKQPSTMNTKVESRGGGLLMTPKRPNHCNLSERRRLTGLKPHPKCSHPDCSILKQTKKQAKKSKISDTEF